MNISILLLLSLFWFGCSSEDLKSLDKSKSFADSEPETSDVSSEASEVKVPAFVEKYYSAQKVRPKNIKVRNSEEIEILPYKRISSEFAESARVAHLSDRFLVQDQYGIFPHEIRNFKFEIGHKYRLQASYVIESGSTNAKSYYLVEKIISDRKLVAEVCFLERIVGFEKLSEQKFLSMFGSRVSILTPDRKLLKENLAKNGVNYEICLTTKKTEPVKIKNVRPIELQ